MNDIVETHQFYERIIDLLKHQSSLFLELGYMFREIHDRQLYKDMGDGGFETWKQFLSQPEIAVKPSTAYFYIQIYNEYIARIGLENEYVRAVPYYKLQKLLPIVRKKEVVEAKQIVENLTPLGANDFNDEVDKLKGVKPVKEKPPEVKRCEVCTKWTLLLKDEDICHCQHG